jgi:hypothetical protein
VNSIPLEAHPYALFTAIVATLFLAALVRLWLLRRVEAKLLKNKDVLEKQVLAQQREIMAIRQDANEWRAEMKRQFDIFRAMASEQLGVEEKRFNDLLLTSQQRQMELQASLDMARQWCAELPAAKARVMQLEQALEIDGGEGFSATESVSAEMAPLPDLAQTSGSAKPSKPPTMGVDGMVLPKPSFPPVMPALETGKVAELEQKLASALQRNTTLEQALTAARLRNRMKNSPRVASSRPKVFNK